MALKLEVSHVDKSYPEALTEGTRHREGKGTDPDNRVSCDTHSRHGACEGVSGGSHRCVAVANESEAP